MGMIPHTECLQRLNPSRCEEKPVFPRMLLLCSSLTRGLQNHDVLVTCFWASELPVLPEIIRVSIQNPPQSGLAGYPSFFFSAAHFLFSSLSRLYFFSTRFKCSANVVFDNECTPARNITSSNSIGRSFIFPETLTRHQPVNGTNRLAAHGGWSVWRSGRSSNPKTRNCRESAGQRKPKIHAGTHH